MSRIQTIGQPHHGQPTDLAFGLDRAPAGFFVTVITRPQGPEDDEVIVVDRDGLTAGTCLDLLETWLPAAGQEEYAEALARIALDSDPVPDHLGSSTAGGLTARVSGERRRVDGRDEPVSSFSVHARRSRPAAFRLWPLPDRPARA